MSAGNMGMSNTDLARELNVTEGAIRYHRKKDAQGKGDGRSNRYSGVTEYDGVIRERIRELNGQTKRETFTLLYRRLKENHEFPLGYDALRRYVAKTYPEYVQRRYCIRVETPPGELGIVDWKEDVKTQFGKFGNWQPVNFFIYELGFSRELAVNVSERKDLAAFIQGHQEAFRKTGGLPRWVRTDCLRSAVVKWHGTESVLTETYKRYCERLGLGVFPARPGTPTDKGKIEKRIRDLFGRLGLRHMVFRDLGHLQETIDGELKKLREEWRCGATGMSVALSAAYERSQLRDLPAVFPSLPLKELRATVRDDGTVLFGGNYYQVPDEYWRREVLCSDTGKEVQIWHGGEMIASFPTLPGTKGMVRLNREAIECTERHLGTLTRQWALTVAERQIEYYEELLKERTL